MSTNNFLKGMSAQNKQKLDQLNKAKIGRKPPKPPKQNKMVGVATAYSQKMQSGKAQIIRTSPDSVRIRHRELVLSVYGSTGFSVLSTLPINPGIPAVFPWLSVQAQGWEKYRFNSLRVHSVTRASTSTPGSLLLVPDYNAADSKPNTEQIASSYYDTAEDVPWKDIVLDLDKKRLNSERFIRAGNLAPNLDIKTYDAAQVFICTTDGTSANWSKLWLEYDVELISPQLPSSGVAGSGSLIAQSAISITNMFGTNPVASGSYGMSFANGASGIGTLSFTGLTIGTEYSLIVHQVGTVLGTQAFSSLVGATQVNQYSSESNSAFTDALSLITFTATSNNASMLYSSFATTITASDALLASMPVSLIAF